jgi:hypothetical protein
VSPQLFPDATSDSSCECPISDSSSFMARLKRKTSLLHPSRTQRNHTILHSRLTADQKMLDLESRKAFAPITLRSGCQHANHMRMSPFLQTWSDIRPSVCIHLTRNEASRDSWLCGYGTARHGTAWHGTTRHGIRRSQCAHEPGEDNKARNN